VVRMSKNKLHRGFVRNFEGKRPIGIPTSNWEDNIKMLFEEIGSERADLIYLAQNRD
jgi:hypothetical protein